MGVDARVFAAVNKYEEIEWKSGLRWFSAGYPRGYWPTIRSMIVTMQERFPEYQIYYAPDTADWDTRDEQWLVTPERLASIDAEWAEWDASGQTYAGLMYSAVMSVRDWENP